MDILQKALSAVEAGEAVVLATVVSVTGSAPRAPGARMLVRADGQLEGSVGGGEIEHAAINQAREMLERGGGAAQLTEVRTDCGGKVGVFIERLAPLRRLFIVGAGHVGKAVASMAASAGFAVTVIDRLADAQWLAELGIALEKSDEPAALEAIEHPGSAQVLIATGTHEADRGWAVAALQLGFAGVGVVGSSRKAKTIVKAAQNAGLPAERVAAIRCPVGLAIGAVTPVEIAMAIVAELICLQRTGDRKATERSATS
ncbi:MAG: hypothetical protein DRI90_11030 [Deltaproteobacteria bacterium]|nr:MAG: hypothetical protein DRI90_11030 [Deltaproteobacteria bacterium]